MSDSLTTVTLTLSDEELEVMIDALDLFRVNTRDQIASGLYEEDEIELESQCEIARRLMALLGLDLSDGDVEGDD